ncbi:aspartate aminotransferase family protein [Bauldia litoralis]|uniref:Acetylornithine aminotransferase n=1 Tax=Bauldia litoralis TaxID=665467 RepID=A0A1G6E540_9HYPH|nr:aspartate aminotransferase family protein [Bauldia litoralis]SDB52488.1 acetylornithine/N-succinyldiaminopimelate aminotransferase [Bauldia litoralis]
MNRSPLFETFARAPLAFERGEGVWAITTDGRRMLDFSGGVAVNALGHAHPQLVEALKAQAEKLWHVSNLFQIPEQEALAAKLVGATFADKVFFCNSGAEAVECAIKTARRYQFVSGHPERVRIITFSGAFHGRTLATLAATGNPKYLEGFGPAAGGFDQVPLGDKKALEAAIGPETAAIMVEPIQGEGGVRLVEGQFLRDVRALCDEHGLLLIFDEVQTGIGRTGRLFGYQWSGVAPDIMSSAKGIGGGFPFGACLATDEAAKGMTPGTHGSTFGGNPLAMAVGNTVFDIIMADGFLEEVQRKSLYLKQRLASVVDSHPDSVGEIRGEGMLIGVRCIVPAGDVIAATRDQDLMCVAAGENVVRLLPPLNVTEAEIDEGVKRFDAALTAIEAAKAAGS